MNPNKQEQADNNDKKPILQNTQNHKNNDKIKSIPDNHTKVHLIERIKNDTNNTINVNMVSNQSSIQIPPKMPKIEPATPSPSTLSANKESVSSTANHKDSEVDTIITNKKEDNIKDNESPNNNKMNNQSIFGSRSHRRVINPPRFGEFKSPKMIHQPPKKRQRIEFESSRSPGNKMIIASSSSSGNNGGNGNNNSHNINNSMFNELQFWKNRAQTLEQKLKIEEKRRVDAEKERDQYQSVLKNATKLKWG